jgi:hypothetical protein
MDLDTQDVFTNSQSLFDQLFAQIFICIFHLIVSSLNSDSSHFNPDPSPFQQDSFALLYAGSKNNSNPLIYSSSSLPTVDLNSASVFIIVLLYVSLFGV